MDGDEKMNIRWQVNDQGELLGKLSPQGYEEISRAKLLPTIANTRGRDVLWCHPPSPTVAPGA